MSTSAVILTCLVVNIPYGTALQMKCLNQTQEITMHVSQVEKSTPVPFALTDEAVAKRVLWNECSQKTVALIIGRSNEHDERPASVTCGGPAWETTYTVHGQIVDAKRADAQVRTRFPE